MKDKKKKSRKAKLPLNQIVCGHNIRVMRKFSNNSIDSIVTDPPYGLEFMGKEWDKLGGGISSTENDKDNFAMQRKGSPPFGGGGQRVCYGKSAKSMQHWHYRWARECLRVAKPGAFMLVFGGTRTFHRLTCALEDAGWQIRDCMMWLYGSGFPKSLDISKQLDKQEEKKWNNIVKAIDNLDKYDIMRTWKRYTKNVKSVGLEFRKRKTEVGKHTKKKDSVLVSVRHKTSLKKSVFNVIIAELNLKEVPPTSGANISIVRGNADTSISQLQRLVTPVEKLLQNQNVYQYIITSIAQGVDKELPKGKTMDKIKEDEVLKICFGSKKFLEKANINVLCVALTNVLKLIILNQSKTFLSLDTKSQMVFVSAMNVIITKSIGEHLITFMVDILKSKSIDKAKGKKRKIVGRIVGAQSKSTGKYGGWGNDDGTGKSEFDETLPASKLAKLWNGYGTALKSSFEPILLCQKPLTTVLFSDIIYETQNLLGALLCQLLLNANSVEKFSKYSPNELEEVSVSVLMLVDMIHIDKLGKLSDMMGMFKSQETVSMCLNTAKLWSNILDAIFINGSMFTTETAISLTTGLRILNCLLYKNIPAEVVQGVSRLVGLKSCASDVEKSLKETKSGVKNIRDIFAPVLVILSQLRNGTNAKSVKRSLQLIIPSVNSVLLDVLQSITTEKETRLVPNFEPIIVAMKPVDGNFAKNVEKYGVAGLNIDRGRIDAKQDEYDIRHYTNEDCFQNKVPKKSKFQVKPQPQGRWPANVILDEDAAKILDKQSGISKSKGGLTKGVGAGEGRVYSIKGDRLGTNAGGLGDSGGASRFFYIAKASRSERNAGLSGIEGKYVHEITGRKKGTSGQMSPYAGVTGDRIVKNTHPTVKPLQLMHYLCMLLKMPNKDQVILDPFVGSGTTCVACKELGMNYIGIDNNEDYCEITRKRLGNVSPSLFEKPKKKKAKKKESFGL